MNAKLVESFEIAPDVRHFVFEVPAEDFSFAPGQFVSLTGTFHGKEITRAYSIASAPDGKRFDLCLNRVVEGLFSPWLFEMKPGDSIDLRPPLGFFVLRQPPREAVFIATGTGIAPFRSMLLAQLAAGDPRPFSLLFGVRHEHGILYRGEFERLAREHPNFRFLPTLTRPGPSWTGLTGRVQNHITDAVADRRDLDVYICGLKLMVDDVRAILKRMGFDRKQIVYEKYD
ncbi:MAG: ferredoxin--NADP reductase [Bryobacteraceae bacterium]